MTGLMAQALRERPFSATLAALLLLVHALVALRAGSATPDVEVLLALGAHEPGLALAEPWRLVASALLHAGPLHLGANLGALLWLGARLEPRFAPSRLAVVFALSALGGALAGVLEHALRPRPVAVLGASGALAGLLLLALRDALRRPEVPEPEVALLTVACGLALVAPLLAPGVDLAAHLGGAAVGAALGGRLAPGRPAPAGWRVGAGLAALAFAAALGVGLSRLAG